MSTVLELVIPPTTSWVAQWESALHVMRLSQVRFLVWPILFSSYIQGDVRNEYWLSIMFTSQMQPSRTCSLFKSFHFSHMSLAESL